MTADEIIKAFEKALEVEVVHGIEARGYYLSSEILKATIDIFCRQKAEIESRDKRESYLFRKIHERDSEIDHLRDPTKMVRTEAIKEFAERLKIEAFLPLGTWCSERVVTEAKIDNLVKEMTGGQSDV